MVTTPPPRHARRFAVAVFAGHRLDVDEARPRLHLAREQREVLAQRVALELEREVEVTQRGMTVELDAEHLPRLALVPVGAGVHRHPRLGARVAARRRRSCSTTRRCAPRVDSTIANTWKRPARPGDAVGRLLRLRGRGRVARALVDERRRRASSRCRRRTRGSRSRAAPCRTARRGATRRGARARRRRRSVAPCSTIASPSSACEPREHLRSRPRRARAASTIVGSVGVDLGLRGTSSANDDRLPLRRPPALGRVLVLDALLQHHDALDERLGPRRATRARTRRPG